jgi:H/ACA ribonucleoprotein complex subunit 3
MDISVRGKLIKLTPTDAIGKGGEADIYQLGPNLVAKIFKTPTHPDLNGNTFAQQAAKERLNEHQQKLPQFPKGLPTNVIAPVELVTEPKNATRIMGYTMPFVDNAEVILRYGEKGFRQNGIPNSFITGLFKSLHGYVGQLHSKLIVIGDFNDLNVLIKGDQIYIIDADSMQFGPYLCKTYTPTFVDPRLCDPNQNSPIMIFPHNEDSDWFAFNAMLFKTWLFVAPYGGIYRPKGPKNIIENRRPLERISVFNPDVKYPRPAIPLSALNDELKHHFVQVFEKDQRGEFPFKLLDKTAWQECPSCHAQHCCVVCPFCKTMVPKKRVVIQVKGTVTAEAIFDTPGVILAASFQGNVLRWLYHEDGHFKRENGRKILAGNLDPLMRFRICGERTAIGFGTKVVCDGEQKSVDTFGGNLPMFDTNSKHMFWLTGGRLLREDKLAPMFIGDVLRGQTLFWVGETFGMGFSRAGEIDLTFTFHVDRKGINHFVKLPFKIHGQLIDSTCLFTDRLAWFGAVYRHGGQTDISWAVLDKSGTVLAHKTAPYKSTIWLNHLRGKAPVGNVVFVATDDGMIRTTFDKSNGEIFQEREFPDTEPFIDSSTNLIPSNTGLYAVSAKEIKLIKAT